MTLAAVFRNEGTSQRNNRVGACLAHCATMNLDTMPENASVSALARVTAGFANDVDAVNR